MHVVFPPATRPSLRRTLARLAAALSSPARTSWRSTPLHVATGPFDAALRDILDAAIAHAATREICLRASSDISQTPPDALEAALIRAASLLVHDLVAHSLQPRLPGRLRLALQISPRSMCLVAEDDGWTYRSNREWARDNAALNRLARHGGGSLRRECDWAVNRTLLQLPTIQAPL